MEILNSQSVFLSTIAADAAPLARQYGLGLEIAEFCTAYNMDLHFPETDAAVRGALEGVSRRIFHGPYNELFPCAIDPKARALAAERYAQAARLAGTYGAGKLILHSGYAPFLYYDCWFEEQSVQFWRAFLPELPSDMVVCLENVLETHPEPLRHVVEAVGDPRLRICLDVGHANCYSRRPIGEWLEVLGPFVSHCHLHNNPGDVDCHGHLPEGSLDLETLLLQAVRLCPGATFTLEITDPAADVLWLLEKGLLSGKVGCNTEEM